MQPIFDEVEILKALGKGQYYGHVERQNIKGFQTIVLRKKGRVTLKEFLKNNNLTMQQALSIMLKILISYHETLRRGAIHRYISDSSILIKTLHAENEYEIIFIHWRHGVLVRKRDKNGYFNPSYTEPNAYGDPAYVGHDIAVRLCENNENRLETAKRLTRYNKLTKIPTGDRLSGSSPRGNFFQLLRKSSNKYRSAGPSSQLKVTFYGPP